MNNCFSPLGIRNLIAALADWKPVAQSSIILATKLRQTMSDCPAMATLHPSLFTINVFVWVEVGQLDNTCSSHNMEVRPGDVVTSQHGNGNGP